MKRAALLAFGSFAASALVGALGQGEARAESRAAASRDEGEIGTPSHNDGEIATATTAKPTTATPSTQARVAAGVGALVPGLLVHGTGHFLSGDAATGRKLLAMEGAGLGAFALGGVPLVLTGASRRIVGPAAAVTIGGVGLFAISALADLYGVLAPAGGFGVAPRRLPSWQTELGYRYVYNPVFDYRSFVVYGIDFQTARVRVSPSAWFATDDTNARLRLAAAVRVWSVARAHREGTADGSYLEWQGALTHHAYTSNRFALRTAETSLAGRVDLAHVGPSLAGSFAAASLGIALQNYRYRVTGVPSDTSEMLLATFGFGIYLGGRGRRGPDGELMAYYDHRHDGFVAGLKMTGLGSGVAGHFGLQGRCFFDEHWGVSGEVMAGSALVGGISVLFRQGGQR